MRTRHPRSRTKVTATSGDANIVAIARPSRLCLLPQPNSTMSKSQDSKKQARKQPQKTLKEKKQAKLAKKQAR